MNRFGKIILLSVLTSFFLISIPVLALAGQDSPTSATPDYNLLVGSWQQTDGGYRLKVSNIKAGGQATVEYFNPRSIHVAQTTISIQKELVKLFIKFQDKGYEGSTYTLYYYAEKDALVGFYYQAAMDRTFEVIFVRKSS